MGSPMNRLIVVRHAEPDIDTGKPAAEWPLTSRGVASSRRLATVLSGLHPTVIVASPERKAVETAMLIAESLELPMSIDERIAEQGAGPDEFLEDYNDFRELVRRHFEQSDDLVFRQEPSRVAGERFGQCVASCMERAGGTDVPVLVSHGRIMASWLGRLCKQSSWDIWNEFRMPDLIEVDLDRATYRAHEVPLF
jgi:broad specificity phosphatase PhoE